MSEPTPNYGVAYIAQADNTPHQVGGNHYDMPIPVDVFCHRNNIPFLEGCVIKYVCRFKSKDGKRDLEKARDYINRLIAYNYPED